MTMVSDVVLVPVPKEHLMDVYALLASLAGPGSGAGGGSRRMAADPGNGTASSQFEEWTNSRLAKLIAQCSPRRLAVLRALADRPDEWLTAADLASAISPDADRNTVAGTLGAFGRGARSRIGVEDIGDSRRVFPFESKYDHAVRGRVYRMPAEMAQRIRSLLESQ